MIHAATCFDPMGSSSGGYQKQINTMRTGDADLCFYITTVQDG